jgi:CRISPR-associated protein Csm5
MTTSPITAIEKPQVYESKRIRLTSPILHIGSEVSQLNPFEFVEAGNKVYLPDTDLLARELYKRGKLQDYITAIEHRESISYLLKQVLGDQWWEVKLDGKPIFPEHKISQKWTDKSITNLRPMIRNGFGQLYIPGTSIKGAIRTAIAYYLIKHAEQYQVPQQQRISEIEQRLREKLQNRQLQQKPKEVSKFLFMERLFTDFHLIYQEQPVRGKVDSSNTDFMRAIHVTDSSPLLSTTLTNKRTKKTKTFNQSIIAEVIVSSHDQDWKAKYRSPIFAEIAYNVRTEFTLTLDTEMLSWFRHHQGMTIPFTNLDELLKICCEFAQEQWDGEHDYWNFIKNHSFKDINLNFDFLRDFYQTENCPYDLRLGWGSGMNGTTIGWLLNDDLRSEIRDVCGISAPNFEAPKSRRSVKNKKGEIRYVPGWIKFEER